MQGLVAASYLVSGGRYILFIRPVLFFICVWIGAFLVVHRLWVDFNDTYSSVVARRR